jgi:hypothetical protein
MNNIEALRNHPDVVANPALFALVCEAFIDLSSLTHQVEYQRQQKQELLTAFTTAFEQGTYPEEVVANVRLGKYSQ